MVNPGSFRGARKQFLIGEKATYKLAVEGGYTGDALADIQRRYFKRFPISLPHEEEPTPEFLASVDDDAPEPEVVEPDETLLSKEEYMQARSELESRRKSVTFRKAQIKRWLTYQHMKDHDFDPKQGSAKNPYRVMLHQLTGVSIVRPRLRTPVNTWRKTQRDTIEAEVRRRVAAGGLARKDIAALRDKVARDLFSRLTKEDRDKWATRAKEEHEALLAQWKQEIEGKPSTSPAGRQRCIQGLVRFMQPILDNVCEATGWKATLIAGGPEPANGGRLNVVSIHSGTAPGDVEMNYGRSEQIPYKKYIVPSYGRFLQKCYPVEECRARALPDDGEDEFGGLASLGLEEEGVNVDPVPDNRRHTSPMDLSPPQTESLAASSLPDPTPVVTSSTTSADSGSHHPVRPSAALPESSTRPPAESPSRPSRAPSPNPSQARSPNPSRASSPSHSTSLPSRHSDQSGVPYQTKPPLPSVTRIDSALPLGNLADHPIPMDDVSPLPVIASQALPRQTGSPPDSVPPDSVSPASGTSPSSPLADTAIPLPQAHGGDSLAPPPPASLNNTPNAANHGGNIAPTSLTSKRPRNGDLAESPTKRHRSTDPPSDSPTETTQTRSRSSPHPALSGAAARVKSRPRKSLANNVKSAAPAVSTGSSNTNGADQGVEPPPSEETTPKWFKTAVSMFESESLGDRWDELVALWIMFERKHCYAELGQLKSRSRPPIVGEWIKRARAATFRPIISNITDFEEDFRLWWTSLQPQWRVTDGVIMLDKVEGDWEILRKPGQNGLLSVLAALFYWGIYAVEHNEKDMWGKVVQDCKVALSHLL